jgi:hypothetical protein
MGPSREWAHKNKAVIAALATVLVAIVWIASEANTATPTPTQQIAPPSTASSTEAASEFEDLMHMSQ